MDAIITKYLGPTDTKGSRIKATLPDNRSVTVSYNPAVDSLDNHEEAAWTCADKFWDKETTNQLVMISGYMDGCRYAHVFQWVKV